MTGIVAITGSGGFIGAAAARHYLAAGWQVRGLDRPGVSQPDGITAITGSVTDDAAITSLVAGASLVVHTAALVAESGDWTQFHELNALAPRRVALAARAAGARSFVHLSSVMVHGFTYPDGSDEGAAFNPANNPYCWSKINSEYQLRGLDEPGTFAVHIVRPGDVYGPGSVPWVVRPVEHMRSNTFLYVDPRKSVINHLYIDNLIDAIDAVVAAGDRMSGVPVIVTDGERTLSGDYFGWFAGKVGNHRHPTLPGWLAEPAVGALGWALPQRLSTALDLDRQSIRYLRRRGTFCIDRIRSLGWQPGIDLHEGRLRTAEWLATEGLIAPLGATQPPRRTVVT